MLTKKEYKQTRAALLMADVSFAEVGRKFEVSREFVSQAVRGKWDSEKAELIREYVNKKVAEWEAEI